MMMIALSGHFDIQNNIYKLVVACLHIQHWPDILCCILMFTWTSGMLYVSFLSVTSHIPRLTDLFLARKQRLEANWLPNKAI